MPEQDDPQVIGSPGKVVSLRFNLGTPKAGTQQALGTFLDGFEETRGLFASRPVKGIDPPTPQPPR
jgi:hypothetical protein